MTVKKKQKRIYATTTGGAYGFHVFTYIEKKRLYCVVEKTIFRRRVRPIVKKTETQTDNGSRNLAHALLTFYGCISSRMSNNKNDTGSPCQRHERFFFRFSKKLTRNKSTFEIVFHLALHTVSGPRLSFTLLFFF